MSSITGGASCIATPPLIFNPTGGAPPPPPLTGSLSTQFNATFGDGSSGLGMLNLIMFG
jgi:hypothetical protein